MYRKYWLVYFLDLYTFDESEETATRTYNEVISAYESLFTNLQVPFRQGLFSYVFYFHSLLVKAFLRVE